MAVAVPVSRAALLLPERLAEDMKPGQAQWGVWGTVEGGLRVVSRADSVALRTPVAAAARMGATAADDGMSPGAGREAVRPIEGVFSGVFAPRLPPGDQHAESVDARNEPLLRS